MNEILELNREEITRLSRMDDLDGHAWALYLSLKKYMEEYTGLVCIEFKVLIKVLREKLILDEASDLIVYINKLLAQLIRVELITDYLATHNSFLSVKLPIAYVDTCMECHSHH